MTFARLRQALLLAALAALFQPAAPEAQPASSLKRFEFEAPHMGTTFRIVLHAADASVAERASARAFVRVAELDARLSDYRADSELNRVAREAAGRPIEVGEDLFRILSTAQSLAVRTGGAFDVSAGAVTRLWRRARRLGALPSKAEIEAAKAASGWQHLLLDAERRTVRLLRPGIRFDLGGIAKGYAADAALEELRASGVSRALVAAGGDIAAGDAPPGAEGWTIEIAGWKGAPALQNPVVRARAGVSTSGDTEQWLEVDGIRYSHIVDPRTGRALTERRLASVIAPDATTSDMLATAASVLGAAEALRLVGGMPGAALLMATERDGAVKWIASAGWPVFAH